MNLCYDNKNAWILLQKYLITILYLKFVFFSYLHNNKKNIKLIYIYINLIINTNNPFGMIELINTWNIKNIYGKLFTIFI